MSVYRPQYTDKKSGTQKRTKVWYYKFIFAGRLIKESAKTTSKTVAKDAEKRRRRELEESFNGIRDERDLRVRLVSEVAASFLQDYSIRQPKSAVFAKYALGHIVRLCGAQMTVEISDRRIARYQTERLAEGAAPKTINEEIQLFLRLLPAAQAGAVRAQLKQDKKLKLKVSQKVGKAYSDDEKLRLLEAARTAKRSKGIYVAMMLAQHAGMRDKEIRNLRWSQVDLTKRVITVGESKTDAGTGRTIPINEELHEVIGEYALWYAERFGAILESWYVFPAGRPRPNDPTSPQTSLKTAWRNLRKAAAVQGRFHDNRHTFVTDLAESGVGDEVIRDMAGHVSKQMLKHYSHIRMEAKRKAVEALTKKKIRVTDERRGTSSRSGVQDSVQGSEK